MSILFDGTNHPSGQQVIDAGCIGCLLYGGTPQYGKNFTPAQYRDYKARGLLTPFVFEDGANDMAGGFNGGSAHASALLADLRRGGVANTEPVGPTVDEHVTAANIPLAVAYQNGFSSYVKSSGWLGPVGTYGFSELLIAVHNAGLADWYWGAGSRSAMPPFVNFWQDNTGTIQVGGSADDRDWILVPLPGGDMPATVADAQLIAGYVIQALFNTRVKGPDGADRSLFDSDFQLLATELETDKDVLAGTAAVAAATSSVLAAIKLQPTGGQVDVTVLASNLTRILGPIVVAALGAAIVKGSGA
jgi:Domain of unknown function (DUF1906)